MAAVRSDYGIKRYIEETKRLYGVLESRLSKAVGKVLGARGTARNWATVCKLEALARDA